MACIDFRSLSLKSPSRYRLAASRCGCREKHPLKPSMYWPTRRSSARAASVVMPPTVRTPLDQYKRNPLVVPVSETINVTK